MQWNAKVADLKQELLDFDARIMALEQERSKMTSAHQQAVKLKLSAQRQVVKFTELVYNSERMMRLQQERFEERELEDFRVQEVLF